MASVTVTVSALAGSGTLSAATVSIVDGYRDSDILDAIEAALEATGEFDGIYRCSASELSGKPADDLRAVCLEPMVESDNDLWDSYSDGPMELVSAQAAITLIVRHQDARVRDRLVDRLKSVARNALNGRSLCNLTLPDFTRFASFQSQKPKPPERMVRGTFAYRYLVDSFTNYSPND